MSVNIENKTIVSNEQNIKKPRISKIKNSFIECKEGEKRCDYCQIPKPIDDFLKEYKHANIKPIKDCKFCSSCRDMKQRFQKKFYTTKYADKQKELSKNYLEKQTYICPYCHISISNRSRHEETDRHKKIVKYFETNNLKPIIPE
jgi:hypothetical protein